MVGVLSLAPWSQSFGHTAERQGDADGDGNGNPDGNSNSNSNKGAPGGDEEARATAEPVDDAERVKQLRDHADATLLRGEFDRARHEFEQILRLLPGDAPAARDAGRAAQAAGEFEYAAEALERAHHFDHHQRDPELHYLRGEALYVLGRDDEAWREHRIAELEIGRNPTDRMQRLWLGRIYARRGYVDLADGVYERLWPPAPGVDAEAASNQADAHLLNKDWDGAERILRRLLARDPKNIHAREMLAWALEAKGDLDGELRVRDGLAGDSPTVGHLRDYGRALERAADYPAARTEYDGAMQANGGDTDLALAASAQRMRYRTTPELAAGLLGRSDSQASSLRGQAGAAIPFGTRHLLSVTGWLDGSHGGFPEATGTVTGLGASLLLATRSGASLLLGGDVRYEAATVGGAGVVSSSRQAFQGGGIIEGDTPVGLYAQADVRLDLHEQWGESPITIQEGGTNSAATANFFVFPRDRRFLLSFGLQGRRLGLAPRLTDVTPTADQLLLYAGGDVVVWSRTEQALRGEVLDEHLLRRTYLNDAVILSYRHYQLYTWPDAAFQARISLAPRASIDNATGVIRKVFFGGRAGVDLRGGVGYDNERQRQLAQAGLSLLIAPTWASRISVSYDMSRETATGLQGILHTGWLSYHADL
jgi:tetratricopeptide (TPR) repeat protein